MRTKIITTLLITATMVLGFGVQGAQARPGRRNHGVCTSAKTGAVHCDAHVIEADGTTTPFVTSGPYGLSPSAMKSAYGWSTSMTAGAGKTIGIVGAYNAPTLASDLAVFSSKFGLPACTVASGCLRRVNQTGGSTLPASNAGWAFETSLDVEWAHAIAPGAHILVVEANGPTLNNLGPAIDYAKTQAQYVSMSWGASEYSGETAFDTHFSGSTANFFAAAGDGGLPAEYPSASPYVTSVGGTTLSGVGTTSLKETAWSNGGGGCSPYEPHFPGQANYPSFGQVKCATRATPDVSADANPNSGAPIYDSTPYQNVSGWFLIGGTSLAAPMIAARAAVAGIATYPRVIYGTSLRFRDITSGNNGAACLIGYDLCSGRGSWLGP